MSVITKDKFSEMFRLIEQKSSEVRDKMNAEYIRTVVNTVKIFRLWQI